RTKDFEVRERRQPRPKHLFFQGRASVPAVRQPRTLDLYATGSRSFASPSLAWMPTEGKLANKLACRSMKSPGISAVFDWACYPTPRMIDASDPTSSETSEACRSAYPCRFPPVIPGVFSFLRIVPAK